MYILEYEKIWIEFLQLPFLHSNSIILKLIVKKISTKIFPLLQNPLLFADFLFVIKIRSCSII